MFFNVKNIKTKNITSDREISHLKEEEKSKSLSFLIFEEGGQINLYRNNKKVDSLNLNKKKETKFTSFETIDNKIIIRNDNENLLLEVNTDEGKIKTNLLLQGIDLEKLKSVYCTKNSLYLSFFNKERIVEIPCEKLKDGIISEDDLIEYKTKYIPDHVFKYNNYLYYITSDTIIKCDKNKEIIDALKLSIGKNILNTSINNGILYVISEFDKENKETALIMIDIEKLSVEDIRKINSKNSKLKKLNKGLVTFSVNKLKNENILSKFEEKILYIIGENELKAIDSLDIEKTNPVIYLIDSSI